MFQANEREILRHLAKRVKEIANLPIMEVLPEIILADTYTCHYESYRFTEWVKICREVIEEWYPK